jgi:hypothetical protein
MERNCRGQCEVDRTGYSVAYPGTLFGGGRGSTNSVEDRGQRERGSGGGSPLVRGSGGSCSLVQEISFHKAKFS